MLSALGLEWIFLLVWLGLALTLYNQGRTWRSALALGLGLAFGVALVAMCVVLAFPARAR